MSGGPDLAIIGDLHFGISLHGKVPNVVEQQKQVVMAICEQIGRMGITDVILLGDVLHYYRPSAEVICAVMDIFLSNPNLHFYWICGNHDRVSSAVSTVDAFARIGSASGNLDMIFEPQVIGGCGFLPYPHAQVLEGAVVSFGHFETAGVRLPSGLETVNQDERWSREHHYVAGHIHIHQQVPNSRTFYLGTPYQTNWGEHVGPKYWATGTFIADNELALKTIEVAQPWILETRDMYIDDDFFREVPPAPTYLKVRLHNGMTLPRGWLRKHPNCFPEVVPVKREYAAGEKPQVVTAVFDPLEGVEAVLAEHGLSKADIEYAMEILRKSLK